MAADRLVGNAEVVVDAKAMSRARRAAKGSEVECIILRGGKGKGRATELAVL